jgi:hypothetical protein
MIQLNQNQKIRKIWVHSWYYWKDVRNQYKNLAIFRKKTFRILLNSWLILRPRKHTFLASFEKKIDLAS